LIEELDPELFGFTRVGNGKWASCIRFLNPFSGDTLKLIELEDNEAAVSMTICVFSQHPNERLLVVGTVKDHILAPKQFSKGFLKVYRFVNDNNDLKLFQEVF
jgi:splicing factor 3B subunit 3